MAQETLRTTPLETKQESKANAVLRIAPLHPETAVADEKEKFLLSRFTAYKEASGNSGDVSKAYNALLGKLEGSKLSPAALFCFANACYSYWQQQWLDQEQEEARQRLVSTHQAYFAQHTAGRTLFRSTDQPPQYYWASKAPQPNDSKLASNTAKKGVFLECYPLFEHGNLWESEGIEFIYAFTPVTVPTELKRCQEHTQAKQREQFHITLWKNLSLVCNALVQQGPEATLIMNLQLTQLCLSKGYVSKMGLENLSAGKTKSCFAIFKPGHAVYYLKQALGHIAALRWKNAGISKPLEAAAMSLRNEMDKTLIHQLHARLMEEQQQHQSQQFEQPAMILGTQLHDLFDAPDQSFSIVIFLSLLQKISQVLMDFPLVSAERKKVLLLAIVSKLHQYKGSDPLRLKVNSALSAAKKPGAAQKQLLSLTEQIQSIVELLHPLVGLLDRTERHPENYALFLLQWYEQRLADTEKDLDKNSRVSGPYQEFFQQTAKDNQAAKQQCTALHGQLTAFPPAVSVAAPPLPTITPSAWFKREAELAQWRQNMIKALADEMPIHLVQAANTNYAKRWFHGLCAEVETQLGDAPCAFAITVSGSCSRGEVSPLSDVDFQLLIQDANVKHHPYFEYFLELLLWKAASMPNGVLTLERQNIKWLIEDDLWVGTPQEFIKKHIFLPVRGGEDPWEPENFNVQWLVEVYASHTQADQAKLLWANYRDELAHFLKPANAPASYPQLGAICFQHKIASLPKDEIEGDGSPLSAVAKVGLKSVLFPITNTILCLARFTGVLNTTETQALLNHLEKAALLPSTMVTRIRKAVTDLHSWRHRAHLAQLQKPWPVQLKGQHDSVFVWPDNSHLQALLEQESRECYLSQSETERLNEIRALVIDTLVRSVEGFRTYASRIPVTPTAGSAPPMDPMTSRHKNAAGEAKQDVDDPSLSSSSYTTTTAPEAKREVSEEEAIAILAAQSRTVTETKSPAPSSAIQFFNPLAAAVEWTRQLTKPILVRSVKGFITYASQIPAMLNAEPTPVDQHLNDPSILSSVAQVFNPLAAAVEWTLQQLAKPKDDKASSEADHTSRTVHVQWLAQVMGSCANELPASEPHSNDPTHVKQDAEFRKHWQIYWAIPTTWRGLYIEQLHQRSAVKLDTIFQSLVNAPNHAGWRLSIDIRERQWQHALRPLFAAEPQSTLPDEAKTAIAQGKAVWASWADQNTIRWAPLRQECANVLIDAKQQRWQPKHNKDGNGNHRLYALQTQMHSFWIKAYPEQPGTEYLVTALDRRLGVNGTPAQQLMALHHAPLRVPDGTPQGMQIKQSAILLSQHVADAKDTLHRRIKHEPQCLEKLDFLAFAKTLLRVLLTNPEDDKGSDYFLVPIASSDKYQLIRIDNERAFLPVTHITQSTLSNQEDLQVKSILYCLDQMLLPWSSDPRTVQLLNDLHQTQPSALIIDLLQDIEQQHTHWQQLFSKASIAQHASLQDPWMSIPTFMLPEGLESALLNRLRSLQTVLRLLKPQAITGLKLLKRVQPKLARYYNQALFQGKLARDPQQPQANVQARFNHVAGRYYQQSRSAKSSAASSNDHQTSMASGPAVLSRQLSITLPELAKNQHEKDALVIFVRSIWLKQAHSVQQALTAVATWQHLEVQRVMKGLLALRKESQIEFGLLAAREQQQLLDQLLSKETKQTAPLTSQQQQFLLTALAGAQCHHLDLRPFAAVLTEELLLPILTEWGQQLIRLNISGCTLLPSGILGSIAKHASHLEHLLANDQSRWVNLSLGDFEALTRFECDHATALMRITFAHLPALKHLSLQQARQLTHLADQGLGIIRSTTAWRLPALQRLDVRGCQQLRTVQLWVEHPEQLSMQTAGCEQLQLPQVQSPQHAAPAANYLTHLASEKQLSAFLTEPFKRQGFLATIPRLAATKGKMATQQLIIDDGLYTNVCLLSSEIKASLGSADDEQLVQRLKRIAMLLAMSLFAHGEAEFAFTVTPTNQQAYAVWEAVLKSNATQATVYAGHLPSLLSLRNNDGVYQFKEPAEYDFWLASALLEMAQADTSFQAAALRFFNQRSIQDAPAAVNFLVEIVQSPGGQPPASYTALRHLLFDTIARSAREPQWAQASSNAATLLNACQEPLSHQRWAGVQLAGADLRYCVLAHSDLRGANLRGAQLMRSMLYQSNLTGADLRGVRWDNEEFPRLGLKEFVRAVVWHPTKPLMVVAQGNTILQFNCETGEQIGAPLTGHTSHVTSVAYRPDGERLVSGSCDKTLRQWDAETGKQIGAPLTGHTGGATSVAYRPDGRRLVSGSWDYTVRQWDAETGKQIGAPLTGHTGGVTSVAYHPDGRRLVSASHDNTLRQWGAETGKQIGAPLTGHTSHVTSVAYRPDGRRLVSGSLDTTVRQWSAETGQLLGAPLTGHITGHKNLVTSVAYRPDGRRLVSGSLDRTVRQWDAETGAPLGQPLTGHTGGVTSVAYRPDGRRLVSASGDNTLRQWDAQTGKKIGAPLIGHTRCVTSVAYRPDGRRLVSASGDNTLRQWDAEADEPIGAPLTGHIDTVTSVAYRSDGRRLVSGSADRTVRQWDAETGKQIGAPLTGHTDTVTSVAYRPDGRRLVSGSDDDTLRQWDAESGKQIGAPFFGHTSAVTSVAYRPDGRRLVSASCDNTVQQWDAETGEQIGAPLTGHTSHVTSVAYRPDGRCIVSGSKDKTIRLWDADSHHCLAVLQWHQIVNSVVFCPLNPEPISTSAESKAVVTLNAAAKTAEYQLAIGDDAGTVSVWAISAEHPEQGFRLVHLSKQVAMPLMANGALLKNCRMSTLSKRLLAQHGGKVDKVIVDDTDTLADSKTSQSLTTTLTGLFANITAFFQSAPRSQPIESKETKQERKGISKDPQTQARLNAVQALIDTVYPADDLDHADKRAHHLGQLVAFQQRAELTPEDLYVLEKIEKELQEQQLTFSRK